MLGEIKKAVFIGAHTDDECACVGTLHRLVQMGCEVHVITAAPAAIQTDRQGGRESLRIVIHEWLKSMHVIGVKTLNSTCLNLVPSCDLTPFRQQICQHVFDWCEREKPDAAFILSPEDENTAHSIVGVECERVMRGRVPITIRCLFPWNHGRPNLFVKLDREDMQIKRQVMECYQSQQFRYRYADMIHHQAIADGLSVKVEAAERFELIRAVV